MVGEEFPLFCFALKINYFNVSVSLEGKKLFELFFFWGGENKILIALVKRQNLGS